MIGRLDGYTGDGFSQRRAYINTQNDLLRQKNLIEKKLSKTTKEDNQIKNESKYEKTDDSILKAYKELERKANNTNNVKPVLNSKLQINNFNNNGIR